MLPMDYDLVKMFSIFNLQIEATNSILAQIFTHELGTTTFT